MSLISILLLTLLALGSVYSYLFYPCVLMIVPGRRDVPQAVDSTGADMTIIIAAHNEAARIAQKVDNTLLLRERFPELEIIVASDASVDNTDQIVAGFVAQNVDHVRSPTRRGKEYAQELAIAATRRDIIIFTDTGTNIRAGSLDRIVALFADSSIGAVSSEDRIVSDQNESIGEGLYVRYEMWLRRLETERAGLVGLSGSFFAARRDVLQSWDATIPSDFCVAISARKLGYRSVSDPGVIGEYRNVERASDEMSRKIRTVMRGMAALANKSYMLNFRKYGLFSFQLFSHKLMRWAAPWFALSYFVLACVLSLLDPLNVVSLIPVLAFFIPVAVAAVFQSTRTNRLIGPIYYLYLTNVAIVRASLAFLAGRRITTWAPSRR